MASRQILFRTDCSDEEQACVLILKLFSFLAWTGGNTFGLSINSCIILQTQLILKANLINGYCSARARTYLLTHFQQQRNAAPCWGPSCNSKQHNVFLPCREINLKFWAREISCFAWHFTATQHVPCTLRYWSCWNEFGGGNRDSVRARIPPLWRQAGELRIFTWRRLQETLETLPVSQEAASELERVFRQGSGVTGHGEWLLTDKGQG